MKVHDLLGPGSLFIVTDDEHEIELPHVLSAVELSSIEEEAPELGFQPIKYMQPAEITCKAHIRASMLALLLGITDQVLTICANRRVIHLSKSKRKRVRKKNIRRAFKILEKQAIKEALK